MRKVLAAVFTLAFAPALALAQGNAEKGKSAFVTYCASCHGSGGAGDGPAAAALTPKPRNLTGKTCVGAVNDDYLSKVIEDGGPAVGKSPLMAGFGSALKDDDVRDLIAFIRALGK